MKHVTYNAILLVMLPGTKKPYGYRVWEMKNFTLSFFDPNPYTIVIAGISILPV